MSDNGLWKYCTPEQVKSTLHSFDLLSGIPLDEDKELSCLYAVSNHIEKHYRQVQIPKRKGGVRTLSVPDDLLCTIQKNILCHILCERSVSACAAAYKKHVSVLDNARPHVKAAQMVKLDIRDFFGNITNILVYQYAFPAVYFPPAIRKILTELCCYQDCLPQGAPTSPAVSNLVMKPFDEYMGAWCKEKEICYTRYCDDLTFSWKKDTDVTEVKALIGKVRGFLHAYGFEMNNKKTRILNRNMCQSVTGIVVNEKPQVNRKYRRDLRQEIYYCRKYGVESHLERTKKEAVSCQKYLQKLLGKINYVCLVNPEDNEFRKAKAEVTGWMQADCSVSNLSGEM